MAWVCVNNFGTELIFETEPHKAVYSWRDDYGFLQMHRNATR